MAAFIVLRNPTCKAVLCSAFQRSVQLRPFASRSVWDISDDPIYSFNKIPGPSALPVVGNVWRYYLGKYQLENAPLIYEGYLKEYGPLVKERSFFGRTLVHVFDPMDMHKIYCLDKYYLPHRVSHWALDEYRKSDDFLYRNGGLPSTNGKEWSYLREKFGENHLNKYSNEAFEMITDDLVAKINSQISLSRINDVVLLPMFYDWALECIGVVALGKRLGCFNTDPDPALASMIRCIYVSQGAVFYTENLPRIFTRKYAKQLAQCQHFIAKYMQHQIRELAYKTTPGHFELFRAFGPYEKDEGNKENSGNVENDNPIDMFKSVALALANRGLDDRDIMTLIIDMFQGGIHPTAHILAFALYHLARNSDLQKTVRASLIKKFPNPKDKICSEPLDQNIKNVIRETMRLHPSTIGTGRVLPDYLVLSNYKVPKGTMCILHHQIASKQEEYFFNPDEFIPGRFNDPDMSESAIVANQPFAMGKRACPGRSVALQELGIGLTKILRQFEVSYKYEEVGMRNILINEPDRQIKITFTPTDV